MRDIINDIEVTRAVAASYSNASMEQKTELESIKAVDEEWQTGGWVMGEIPSETCPG